MQLIELKNGKRKAFKPALAKVLIARGLGKEIATGLQYQTRAMQAASPFVGGLPSPETIAANPKATLTTSEAPYGYKKDGTPKKAPGRPAVSE